MMVVVVKTPTEVVREARAALNEMRPEIARRITGRLVFPDGKESCRAGAFADDIGAGKTSEFDPNHCLISGGPWIRPVLERDIPCTNAGEDLVWGSLIQKAQLHLRALAQFAPAKEDGWQLKLDYFTVVMELCDVVLQGTNLPPGSIPSFLAWAVGILTPEEFSWRKWIEPMPSIDYPGEWSNVFASNNRLAPAEDVNRFPSVVFLNAMARTSFSATQFGDRPFWLRGSSTVYGAAKPGFNWDTTPVFAPPMIVPSYYASSGFGWASWISVNSRFQKIVQGEVAPFAQGFFGCNVGQSYPLKGIAYSKQNWGQDWVNSTCVGSACGMHRFVLPSQVLEKIVPGSTTDRGKAEQALRRAMTMPPNDVLKLIFQETGTSTRRVAAWSFDRIYKLTWYGMPEPARTIDDVRDVQSVGGHFYVMRAQDWAKFIGELDVPALVSKAALEYLTRAKKVVEQLAARGLPVDLKPADIQAMISSVEQVKAGERMAIIGALGSVFQIMGGIVGTIMQLVATAVLGGFLEFLNSSKPPSGQADFSLLLQPFAMRSPGKQTTCSFDPSAEGGAQRITTAFIPTGFGGTGQLFDLSQGRNPPPPAPNGLRNLTAAEENALENLLVEGRDKKRLFWAAGIGAVILGGAALYRYLK